MKALLLIDLQNDFLPGGALAVKDGDQVIPVANRVMPYFEHVFASQDWHPADHLSFASQHPGLSIGNLFELEGLPQVAWPDHCVQGTRGADFSEELNRDGLQHVIQKGMDRSIDSYSSFFDNGHRRSTGLESFLRGRGITELFMMGLATDYCVQFSVLDALMLGFPTTVIIDGCRGVELTAGDCQRAIDAMEKAGAKFCISDSLATAR